MTVFESAAGRFGDSVAGMREMAAEIRRELEATRADLQRGVLEIPRETQEATSEMRRVVSDQIKALNELSSLVSRSRRSVDVTEAVAPAPRKADVQPVKQQDVQVSEVAPAKPKQNGANPVAAPVAAKPSEPKAREDKSSDARPPQQMTIVSAPGGPCRQPARPASRRDCACGCPVGTRQSRLAVGPANARLPRRRHGWGRSGERGRRSQRSGQAGRDQGRLQQGGASQGRFRETGSGQGRCRRPQPNRPRDDLQRHRQDDRTSDGGGVVGALPSR